MNIPCKVKILLSFTVNNRLPAVLEKRRLAAGFFVKATNRSLICRPAFSRGFDVRSSSNTKC